jgi:guanine deaminase
VYAAPKEWVPDLGTPFPDVLVGIQAAAREQDKGRIEHLELQEAREPFTVYLEHGR